MKRLSQLAMVALVVLAALVLTGKIDLGRFGLDFGRDTAKDPADRNPAAERMAGYNWAAQRQIGDPDDCVGRSQSFIQGCKEYAAANRER